MTKMSSMENTRKGGKGKGPSLVAMIKRAGKNTFISFLKSQTFDIQLYSEKCTGRYFKVRDDDLSSKKGSLCTFKIIFIKISQKYF